MVDPGPEASATLRQRVAVRRDLDAVDRQLVWRRTQLQRAQEQIAKLEADRVRLVGEHEGLMREFRVAAQRYWGRNQMLPPANWVWEEIPGLGGSDDSADPFE